MSNGQDTAGAAGPVMCTGCGCYCDDILLPDAIRPLSEAARLCEVGLRYFAQLPGLEPRGWVRGDSVPLDVAVAEAARLLRASAAPGIFGLELVTVETCAAAVRLAQRLLAWLCPWPPDPMRAWGQLAPDLAMSRAEFEQAADLVVYLGCQPDDVQPRHRERHLARGLGPRRRVLFLTAGGLAEVLALRLHLEKGDALADVLAPLAEALTAARCVQLFVGNDVAAREPEVVLQWQTLAARQRQHRRFGVAVLSASGKGRTATEALTWLTGYPGPVWFGGEKPLFRPGVGEAESLLGWGALDTVLWIGLDPRRSGDKLPRWDGVREIQIGTRPDPQADVAIQAPGLDPRLDGHVVRDDGVMLRLAGAGIAPPDPTAVILEQLSAALAEGAS